MGGTASTPSMSCQSVRDPEQGWFATTNQLNVPDGYPHTVTRDWDAPFSLPARRIQPLLTDLSSDDAEVTKADVLAGDDGSYRNARPHPGDSSHNRDA
jgi:penicillin amidase